MQGEPDHLQRDRDAAGRPRNARPRDDFGRPLARTGREMLQAPDDEAAAPPPETLARADALLAEGRPFHAHEVLEALWHVAVPEERQFWQGLAQVAVGLTHAQRGNVVGAVALLRRGSDAVARHAGDDHGVDVAGLVARCADLVARIERNGLEAVSAADLALRLRR
ncbi:MAG: DUF309 domain-containing protein [Mycobacteriales bacterium]